MNIHTVAGYAYFTSPWNWLDILIVFFTVVCIRFVCVTFYTRIKHAFTHANLHTQIQSQLIVLGDFGNPPFFGLHFTLLRVFRVLGESRFFKTKVCVRVSLSFSVSLSNFHTPIYTRTFTHAENARYTLHSAIFVSHHAQHRVVNGYSHLHVCSCRNATVWYVYA